MRIDIQPESPFPSSVPAGQLYNTIAETIGKRREFFVTPGAVAMRYGTIDELPTWVLDTLPRGHEGEGPANEINIKQVFEHDKKQLRTEGVVASVSLTRRGAHLPDNKLLISGLTYDITSRRGQLKVVRGQHSSEYAARRNTRSETLRSHGGEFLNKLRKTEIKPDEMRKLGQLITQRSIKWME